MVAFSLGSLGRSSGKSQTPYEPSQPHHQPPPPIFHHLYPHPHPHNVITASDRINDLTPDDSSWKRRDPFARVISGVAGGSLYDKYTTIPQPIIRQSHVERQTSVSTHHKREYSITSLDAQLMTVRGGDDINIHIHNTPKSSSRYHKKFPPSHSLNDLERLNDSVDTLASPPPINPDRTRHQSDTSSIDQAISSPDKPNSILGDSTDFPPLPLPPYSRRSHLRPSPLNPNPNPTAPIESGYETSSSAPGSITSNHRRRHRPTRTHDILDEMPESREEQDQLRDLRATPGVLASLAMNQNHSTLSLGNKVKADKVLGLDPHAKLASFYLVSGLPRVSWHQPRSLP